MRLSPGLLWTFLVGLWELPIDVEMCGAILSQVGVDILPGRSAYVKPKMSSGLSARARDHDYELFFAGGMRAPMTAAATWNRR